MHTFNTIVYDVDLQAVREVTFNFNSDLSGNVNICTNEGSFWVPGEAILEFGAEYIRLQQITMTVNELLGIE